MQKNISNELTLEILKDMEKSPIGSHPEYIADLYLEKLSDSENKNLIDKAVLNYMKNYIKSYIQQLKEESIIDELTGLANLRGFKKGVKRCINRSNRKEYSKHEKEIALVYLDLNCLKEFNDTYGHQKADKIIKYTGKALKTYTRKIDLQARLGGDEFVILFDEFTKLPSIKDYNEVLGELNKNINDYIKRFNTYLNTEEIKKGMGTVSMGMSILGKDANNLKELLENSDNAMYYAKYHPDKEGLNYHLYNPDLKQEYTERKYRKRKR